ACEAALRVGARKALPLLRIRARRRDDVAIFATAAVAALTEAAAERRHAIATLRREGLAAAGARAGEAMLAIRTLGALNDAHAVQALREIRSRAPGDERRCAAECGLAASGEASVAADLVRRLGEAQADGGLAAALALGKLGAREMLPALRGLLSDGRTAVRTAAAIAFVRLGGGREAARELVSCLVAAREADPRCRCALACALAAEDRGLALRGVTLRRAFDLELDGLVALEEADPLAAADSVRRSVEARLASAFEAFAVEVAAPDLVVVALRSDLDPEQLDELASRIEGDGYSVEAAEEGSSSASGSADVCGASGLRP
ncbi:MAG TPA: hypothetical protein VHF22_02965, partial [Planctomycetota bacterium]|nr:hypothetical protein [Planctomycetota bacterium]